MKSDAILINILMYFHGVGFIYMQRYMIIGKKEMQMPYYLFDCVIFAPC